jgi:pyruvate formate lyase activating enzyme
LCAAPALYPLTSLSNRVKALSPGDKPYLVEAQFYDKLPNKRIQCRLCPRECAIDDLERGYCGVRENRDGTYYTLVHSQPCTYHVDPIEKKPLFHFLPGTEAFSLATVGCNVECKFCQNWQISQTRPEQIQNMFLPPDQIVSMAIQSRAPSIAYTYSEPVIFYEYMSDISAACKEKGLKSVMISNGYIKLDPMKKLCKYLTAVKIDLKAITEKFYKETVNGELKPVLDTLVLLKKQNIWTEIVYLVIPTLNDTDEEFKQLSRWVKTNLGTDVPVHFTRFHPEYKLRNLPPTPSSTLDRAKEIADAEDLHYVYVGNVPGHAGENTHCPKCKKIIVRRLGYYVQHVKIKGNSCEYCGNKIPGVWQ